MIPNNKNTEFYGISSLFAKNLSKGKKINMEFKRNHQLYKNIYNPIYKRFIAASQILIDFLKYPFGDYFCYLF